MNAVFADALYWIAVTRPGDPWSAPAAAARAAVESRPLVTTDEALGEFLSAVGRGGEGLRIRAAEMVRSILVHPDVQVIPQTRDGFLAGLALYAQRSDKAYSLVDCVSMAAMRSLGITDVLTNDHLFRQEGFHVLIAKESP